MGWIFRKDIDSTLLENIGLFTKQFEVQIRIYDGDFNSIYDAAPESRGAYGYDDTTGIYKLHFPEYIRKVLTINTSVRDVVNVEYKDFGGNWIFGEAIEVTPGASHNLELESTLISDEFRITLTYKDDPASIEYPTTAYITLDSWMDATRMCARDLKYTREIDPLGTGIKLPHFSVGLENANGQWNKYQDKLVVPYEHIWHATYGEEHINAIGMKYFTNYKVVGNRCMVLVKFLGENWSDADWIIVGIFNIRKFTNSSMSGESAWLAKTPLKVPISEDAYPDQIVENSIARDKNTTAIQIAKAGEREVLTSENEFVGELTLFDEAGGQEPDQEVMLGNTADFGHCQDDEFIYFLVPSGPQGGNEEKYFPNTHTMLVKRMTHTGDGIETVGVIRCLPPEYDGAARQIQLNGVQQWGQVSNILSNALFTRYTRDVHFCCDNEYFYISLCGLSHAKYGGTHDELMYERCMFKVRKDGVGWDGTSTTPIFGFYTHNNKVASTTWGGETPYTASDSYGNLKYSYGDVNLSTASKISDPQDWAENPKIIGPVMLFDDAGTEKILAAHRVAGPYTGTGKKNELWVWDKDMTAPAKMADVANDLHIWSFCRYSDLTWFVCYNDGGDSDKTKLGIMDRDINGDFYIKTSAEAEIGNRYKSLSILGDSLWGGGSQYVLANEVCLVPGLRQLYQCMFKIDGSTIIHELHETNNDYLSYRFPIIKYQGTDLSRDEVEYGQEYLVGDEYVNLQYVINLRTGYISLRQVLPTAGVNDTTLYISYDFVNSFQFFSTGEESSRLGNNALGKISQSLLGIYGVNEYGMIEKIPFSQYQFMSLRHSVIEWGKETEDDGENSMYLLPIVGASDYLTAFEFTPDYDGYIDALRIPVRLYRQATELGSTWTEKAFKIWVGGPTKTGGGDFSGFAAASSHYYPDETILKSEWELLVTKDFYIDKGKIPTSAADDYSPYVWRGFDLGGTFEVEAGKTYAICIQSVGVSHDYYWYQAMTKEVGSTINQSATDTCIAGADISTRGSENWKFLGYRRDGSGNDHGEVINAVIEIKKKKQAINGTNIVDSINPNIDSGFVSKIGGDDSTIKVSDMNYGSVYIKDTDYTITYADSTYWINFTTFNINDLLAIHWFESVLQPPLLSDSRQSNLSETSGWGDTTAIRSCSVLGLKKLPAGINVRINKIFTIPPGLDKDLLTTNEISREGQSEDVMRDWDSVKKKYVRILDDSDTTDPVYDRYKKFAFEFKDPFISGTTGYKVRYGLGSSSDTVNAGTITGAFIKAHDVPLFYKIWFEDGEDFGDEFYNVMFKKAHYQEWRMATPDDVPDIPGNYKLGLDPDTRESGKVPGDDLSLVDNLIKGNSFFIVKHMNEYYGESTLDFVAYMTEEKKFYVNSVGLVVEDPAYDSGDLDKNPFPSSYPGKPIIVKVTPQDFNQNPLFEYHSEVAEDGYLAGTNANVEAWASSRIDRVEVLPTGINAIYSNWSDEHQFVNIEIYGYPLNNVSSIRYRKSLPGAEHVDAKKLEINNDLISSEIMAKLKCDQVIDFWGEERNIIKRSAVYNPAYYPGMIIRLSSEYQDQTEQLYYVLGITHTISSDNMTTEFTKLLEI